MLNLIEERFCGICYEIKPSSEFEQSTKITLPTYRLPWFKNMLTEFKEFHQEWLYGDMEREAEPDEETIASHKNDLRTANDILTIIEDDGLLNRNTAQRLKPQWVEIPINDYQRKWLKGTFSLQRKCRQGNWRDAKERKHERAEVDIKGDIEMIGYFLKIIDISSKDICRNCCVNIGIR
jgi:hypothetical protein